MTRPPPYAATIAALAYAFPVDRLVRELKYRGTLALAEWAAAKLATAVGAHCGVRERVDGVVALPLAKGRQRERGFNQAQEIAARVARELGLPLLPALVRVGEGPPQAGLPWKERQRNVRDVFGACANVRGARLALVDDVMTTGATLAEAARVLRNAGAARLECWVVARTLRPEARHEATKANR